MAEKANHHYVPQLYLRNFADGIGRKSRVFTFDSTTNETFKTSVRNVASKRHFNRIEIDGVDPNYLEDGLAEMEGELAPFLAEVVSEKRFRTSEHFDWTMNLAAQLSVRNPRMRGQLEKLHKDIAERIASLSVSTREIWESQRKRMQEAGKAFNTKVTYEQAKKFHDDKNYDIAIDQTHLIKLEMKMVETVLTELGNRNWCFVSPPDGHIFITCDDPVVLSWRDQKERGSYGPGHGLMDTLITFSLSSDLLLLGTFENLPPVMRYDALQVADANTHIARYSTKQIYARSSDFNIHTPTKFFASGSELATLMRRANRQAQ
ncbi:hypothetical protein DSM110093_02946 [Sulfitobacter sp. DSM 110093]|uniref:DUF4238 domain-containing protein n=1 Tax=Sulfitobacter sp. DSM 110093 TaxID=2883127 RepID=UPI001FAE58A3|nr:DUF4238 domain-containing protein [Sulfitobacter sp. DSM 110093]UOA33134.1 hypothetical protein DSM110093_02946 [Sulfitobacter sp. DSM 110093]